ncbi:MAG: hypothetical protein R3307_09235, partial [Anaerolineales bacterium]|nr:hypothetical protein [Anaerolineales bacterium]
EHDPLLRFDTTHEILQKHFENLSTVKLGYPFHQPPAPFTYEELNRDFYRTVDSFIEPKDLRGVRHVQQKANHHSRRIDPDSNVDLPSAVDRIPAMVQ